MLGTLRFTLCGKGQYLILTGSITPTYQRLQGMFRSHCEVISVTDSAGLLCLLVLRGQIMSWVSITSLPEFRRTFLAKEPGQHVLQSGQKPTR